jgi:hypothetical protein
VASKQSSEHDVGSALSFGDPSLAPFVKGLAPAPTRTSSCTSGMRCAVHSPRSCGGPCSDTGGGPRPSATANPSRRSRDPGANPLHTNNYWVRRHIHRHLQPYIYQHPREGWIGSNGACDSSRRYIFVLWCLLANCDAWSSVLVNLDDAHSCPALM